MMKSKEELKVQKGKKKVITTSVILLLITIGMCFSFSPLFKNLNFGLDLQGGFEVLYEVKSIDGSKMTEEKLTSTYKTLSKRIDSLGVSEPEIIIEGNNKIRVKLAGVTNEDEARKQLATVATLSFRDTEDNLLMSSDVLTSGGARVTEDASGRPAVLLGVKDKDKFYAVTNRVKDYKENMLVIWLDFDQETNNFQVEKNNCGTSGSNCLSAATVSQGFASDVIIQGNFTTEEVNNLVDLINSGSLPSKLTEISSKTVGASFGDETLQKTLIAGIIGVLCIIAILILIYHFAGVITSISMIMYTLLVFFIFWLIGGVLTLPGIAALVLGIGMAVDANVITYSRIKEELYKGKSLQTALKMGSKESFSSIFDSNVTTLLVAIIMFIFGESSVKGFATMLIITIFTTIITMIFITRLILKLLVNTGYFDDKTNFFLNVKKSQIPDMKKDEEVKIVPFKNTNFLKPAKFFVAISCIVLLIGGAFFIKDGFNLGVDFEAGSDISLVTDKKLTKKALREDLKELKLTENEITIDNKNTDIMIKDVLNANKVKTVKNHFVDKYNAKVDIGVVSNVVKRQLINNAILSILLAIIGIILYISIRFKFSYAIASVIALIHDILIIFAIFAIAKLEVSTMFIAAVLAIIGYSINDTIVCFDRIRENLDKLSNKKMTKENLKEAVNISIRETFTRTIWTSLTTIIPVLTLILLGSKEIINFNIAMLIGLISGTYSSIFIATTIFLIFEKKNIGKKPKIKKSYKDDITERMIKGVNC